MLTLSFFNGSWFKLLPGTPSWSLINLLDHSRTQRNIWLLRLLMCHNQMEAIHWTRYRDRAWGFSATWLSMLPEWPSVHQPRSSLNPFVLCSYGDYFTQTRTHTVVNNPLAAAGDSRDKGLIPALGRSPGVGNGNLLQYSCLENSIDRGRLESTGSQVHGDWACMHTHTHTHTHTKEWLNHWSLVFELSFQPLSPLHRSGSTFQPSNHMGGSTGNRQLPLRSF